jgi:membrane-associated phospholipid phosphatase
MSLGIVQIALTAVLTGLVVCLTAPALHYAVQVNNKLDARVPSGAPVVFQSCVNATVADEERRTTALNVRIEAAYAAYLQPLPCHPTNGDEGLYASTRIGSFSKCLPHGSSGEVLSNAYTALLYATTSHLPSAYDAIPRLTGAVCTLVNPQAAVAFELEGADSHSLTMIAPPAFSSAWQAAEAVELYWKGLLRDVRFDQYGTDTVAAAAIADLNALSDYRGATPVTASNLFRGTESGCSTGPYLSQFLLKDVPHGAYVMQQKIYSPTAGTNFVTSWEDYLNLANGMTPNGTLTLDETARYIINGRDLAHFSHIDVLTQGYFQALLILLHDGYPLNSFLPYQTTSLNQQGFATFGGPYFVAMLNEVATRALKHAWAQKWQIHRRLRPEEFGARIDRKLQGIATTYPIHNDVLASQAVADVYAQYGTYLLPQAWPEGAPAHPSYPSGHSTVAGACTTLLKAWFNTSTVISSPVMTDSTGANLLEYTGADLTVLSELHKVAANVGFGRNFGGGEDILQCIASNSLQFTIEATLLKEYGLVSSLP